MFPTFKVSIVFEQLEKDVLSDIVGISAIAQIRQRNSKHNVSVIFDRLSKSLFFHNHLPVTLMVLDEALTIDTLLPDEMFQIQVGNIYQTQPISFLQAYKKDPLPCWETGLWKGG